MAEIIVAGGGNGGLVCAINLVRKGYKVTLFEKQNKDSLGIAQTDAIDMPAFDYAGIEIPEYFRRGKNVITFVPKKPESGTLTLPEGTETSLLVDRIELSNYLFSVAEKEGVSIRYGEEALSPVLLGSRVAGVLTNKGTYYADLVVDACGVNSPLRTKLPEHLKVNRPINKYDVIYSYRGYFNRVPEAPEPQTDYNIYFKDDGNVGFSWLITEFDRVDVLVCRFTRPEDNEISAILNETHKGNPHMGLDLVYGGLHGVIPVCQPLGLMVSDGYAAVGDSAFMTVPLKGSGIAYSMKAGKMLADAVINDTNGCFTAETLWDYQRAYFKEIGAGQGGMAVLKNLLPFMTATDVDKMFNMKIITTEELSLLWENKADAIFNSKGLATLKSKIRLVRDEPLLKELLGNLAVWLAKYAIVQTSLPSKYNKKDVEEWVDKYNSFFDSIRKPD